MAMAAARVSCTCEAAGCRSLEFDQMASCGRRQCQGKTCLNPETPGLMVIAVVDYKLRFRGLDHRKGSLADTPQTARAPQHPSKSHCMRTELSPRQGFM